MYIYMRRVRQFSAHHKDSYFSRRKILNSSRRDSRTCIYIHRSVSCIYYAIHTWQIDRVVPHVFARDMLD